MAPPSSDVKATANADQAVELQGMLFEPGSAKSDPVTLRLAGNLVILTGQTDNRVRLQASLHETGVSDRIAALQRRMTFANGHVFVTDDNDGVDRLLGISGRAALVNWLEAVSFKKFAVMVMITIAITVAIYRYGLPVAVDIAVASTPVPVIESISDAALLGLKQRVFKPTKLSQEKRERLTAAFEQLVSNMHLRDERLRPKLFFHASTLGPNALALPDGTIIVTDALVRLVNEDVVIGVIGHELGHVHYSHGLRLLYRSLGIVALVSIFTGDVGSILEDLTLQGTGLLTLSFAREHEHEADAYSIELLRKSGFEPNAIIPFFELMSKNELGVTSWISTHPSSKERLDNLKKRLQENR